MIAHLLLFQLLGYSETEKDHGICELWCFQLCNHHLQMQLASDSHLPGIIRKLQEISVEVCKNQQMPVSKAAQPHTFRMP